MNVEHQIVITIRERGFFARKRKLGIRFDMLAFFNILEAFGIKLGDDMGAINKIAYEDLISVAIYAGADSYCYRHKVKPFFDKNKVLAWVDDSVITRGHMKEIGKLWTDFISDFTEGQTEKKNKAKG